MTLPFTIDQFLGVFEQYNETVWPSQWILNALAIVAVVGAVKGTRLGSRTAIIILATLWVWTGVVSTSCSSGRSIPPPRSLA
jgi:hypothetical protein